MKVAILGGGPSGLMAAWAAIQWGCDVTVFDRNPETISIGQTHGVFALWDDCDLFLSQKREVRIGIIGGINLSKEDTEYQYAEKVYGDNYMEHSVSISKYMDRPYRTCYNHAEAYQQIIDIIGRDRIRQGDVGARGEGSTFLADYDVAFSTIPLDALLKMDLPHTYSYIYHGTAPDADSFMIYNVSLYVPWSRCSAIFGYFSMEYPERPNTDKTYVRVKKVMPAEHNTNMTLHGCPILLTGRYGAWKKDMLTEDVYYDVLGQLREQTRRDVPAAARAAS